MSESETAPETQAAPDATAPTKKKFSWGFVGVLALAVIAILGVYGGFLYYDAQPSRPDSAPPEAFAILGWREFSGRVNRGDLDIAERMTKNGTEDRPYLELMAGTAAVNNAMRRTFRETYDAYPLANARGFDMERSDPQGGVIYVENTDIVMNEQGEEWIIDLSALTEAQGPVDLDKAQAMRAELVSLAERIRGGEFETADDARAAATAAVVSGAIKSMGSGDEAEGAGDATPSTQPTDNG